MASIAFGKRDGRWFFEARGCCAVDRYQLDYHRAHAVQVLGDGGRLADWDARTFELVDRRGRRHVYAAKP